MAMVKSNETSESASLISSVEDGYGTACCNEGQTTGGQKAIVKTIGYLGSMAIAVNSLAGPAILQLPNQYQRSGLIPTTICLIAVGVLSYFCSLHMANVVSQVPKNKKFDKCIEFSDPFHIFWSHTAYKGTQILFFLTTVCLNVAAIVDTAEVVDSILGLHFKTYGYDPFRNSFHEWDHGPCRRHEVKLGVCVPFSDPEIYGGYVLTLGYLLTTAIFLPICLMDLKENTTWQILGFSISVSSSVYFCYQFSTFDLSLRHASLWGVEYGDMLGVILFNFGLVLAIPAWLHEKKEYVSVKKVVLSSTVIATTMYICVGALGACSMSHVNVNMLSPMLSGAFGGGLQFAGSMFTLIIGLDIPLFSVLTRYNLTHSGLCSRGWANVFVVWLPWLTSWMFYQGDSIKVLLDWGGVLFTSALAYLLPLYLALRVLLTTDGEGHVCVYGRRLARSTQIKILYFLLSVAVVSVIAAIGGQIYASITENNDESRHFHKHHLHRGHLAHGRGPYNPSSNLEDESDDPVFLLGQD